MADRRLVTGGHYLLQDFTPPLQHFTPPETFGSHLAGPQNVTPPETFGSHLGLSSLSWEWWTTLVGLCASGAGTIGAVNLSSLLSQETNRLRA